MVQPLVVSQLCQNLAFNNFGQILTCFVQLNLFGDFTLFALVILSVFVGYVVRYNLPGTLLLPISIALAYVLYMMSGGQTFFLAALIVTLIINGVLVVMGVMNYINR